MERSRWLPYCFQDSKTAAPTARDRKRHGNRQGGFLISFEPERSRLFEQRARAREPFSLELSRLDHSAKTREFFLVCFDGEGKQISAAAMASYKAGPQNTGARNYRFSDFVFFGADFGDAA